MPRHAKNNTAGPTFTYGERRALTGWGTKKVRLGGDSLKDFDACTLCLHQVVEPLVCSKGHLFCKECIYECLLSQKEYIKNQKKLYEERLLEQEEEKKQKEEEKKLKSLEKFEEQEASIKLKDAPVLSKVNAKKEQRKEDATPPGWQSMTTPEGKEVYILDREKIRNNLAAENSKLTEEQKELRKKIMPCFWIPAMTPDAGKAPVGPPPKHTNCPAGGHILRLKQLRPVILTQIKEDFRQKISKKKDFMSNSAKYICPGCDRTLTNATTMTVLSLCGHLHCDRCVERLVKKDKSCLSCGKACGGKKDLIKLQHGGTGFAAAGAETAAAALTPSFMG